MRTLLFTLFAFALTTTLGCAARSEPTPLPSTLSPRDARTVDAETFRAVEAVLVGDAVQTWASLGDDTRQRVWEALVANTPYPSGQVLVQQVAELDSRPRAQPAADAPAQQGRWAQNVQAAGLAWLPATPTLAAAVPTNSEVGATLPERISNIVQGEQLPDSQALSEALGFDVTEAFMVPNAAQQPVPVNTQVGLVPVAHYHASSFQVWDKPLLGDARPVSAGYGYQYAGLRLFTFAIAP